MKILAIGTIAFDTIETPYGKKEKILGGAATFIGFAASILNSPIYLISVVGQDFSKTYFNLFKSKNINIEGVQIIKNEKTFSWSGKYYNNMNLRDTISTDVKILKMFNPIIPESLKNIEVLLLGNLDPKIQLSILNQLQNTKLIILDTMNFWIKSEFNTLNKVIKKTDIIIINDSESQEISGEYNLIKAAEKIYNMGPKFIIIKKGENGVLLYTKKQIFIIPAFPLKKVIDPTGAGDTFIGGFTSYLTKKQNWNFEFIKNALIYANILASFSVEKFGTKKIQELKKNELIHRINYFKSITSFNFLFDFNL